jgi:8-oxo-dGTP pyrophosphatase MutT (NUDIX family)
MTATKISLDNAKQEKLFYFVAGGVIYRESDGRCLILKRSERELVHPGRWGTIGGKLEWADMDIAHPTRLNGDVPNYDSEIEKLIVREAKEESGLVVSPDIKYIGSVAFIRPDGVPVIMAKFGIKYQSGEVKLEAGAFTDYAWVDTQEVKNYPCIDGVLEEVAKTIDLFGKPVTA